MTGSKGAIPRWSIFLATIVWLMVQSAQAREKDFVNSLGMTFKLIPAGTFMMGSPEEDPMHHPGERQHPVTISRAFYMQTTEVTLGQWRRLMDRGVFSFFTRRRGPDDIPVSRVSFKDVVSFLEKLNALGEGQYRLPTEAEWEYAARAGTKTAYSWGSRIDCTRAMFANKKGKFERCIGYARQHGLPIDGPAPVKSFAPNPWGLYDMHGNVWEWCLDWFAPYDTRARLDPRGPSKGTHRVRRGGSWFGQGFRCRSANRAYGHPDSRLRNTGFRLVRVVQP